MDMDYGMIFGATVTVHGDPSVGIQDHTFEVNHLDFDLTCLAEEDVEGAVNDLREKLVALGKAVSGEDSVTVVLHGYDDLGEDEDDYDDSMDGDHASALASAGFGTDEDYGGYDEPYDWD